MLVYRSISIDEGFFRILSFCQNSLSQLSDENSSATEPDKNGKPIAVHFDCLTGALKVLCNLTHDNGEQLVPN